MKRKTGQALKIHKENLGALGFGAPFLYAACGAFVSRSFSGNSYLKVMNIIMGVMLIAVALDMAYSHVYLFRSISAYY